MSDPGPWRWLLIDPEAGCIRTWDRHDDDHPDGALRADARLVAGGDQDLVHVSLALADDGASLAFDDPGVSHALRRRLERPWPGAVSTLLVDWSRIGGAVTVGPDEQAVADDPFATLFPTRTFRVAPGTFGRVPAPVGPGVTRYGSGNPWPWDRYAGQVE